MEVLPKEVDAFCGIIAFEFLQKLTSELRNLLDLRRSHILVLHYWRKERQYAYFVLFFCVPGISDLFTIHETSLSSIDHSSQHDNSTGLVHHASSGFHGQGSADIASESSVRFRPGRKLSRQPSSISVFSSSDVNARTGRDSAIHQVCISCLEMYSCFLPVFVTYMSSLLAMVAMHTMLLLGHHFVLYLWHGTLYYLSSWIALSSEENFHLSTLHDHCMN